ncbi:PepK [Acidianus manzaensis]|uniref:PepK n=1 Tax=Acidianus manzaensis TaxID=282676 RepID=A0A1W6K3Y3_9CREN|nr:PepK [Acidianus manzaensis]
MNGIRQLFDEYFTKYFGRPKTYEDLDKVYDIIKDDIGYAQIKDLREQLGMSLEQFMSIFRDYILQHYELISGGKEGFVQRGVLYGIIRRKR